MSNKKTNPKRIPISAADLAKAKAEACKEATGYAMAIFFTVLCDKAGMTAEQLMDIWDSINELSDSIVKGYVNVADLKYTLKTEYGILIV